MLKPYIILIIILMCNIQMLYSIDTKARYIAHGGGEIDGFTYTNSLEALNKSYADGFRMFELDIIEDTLGNIIAAHDWMHLKNIMGCDSIKEIEVCDTITSIIKMDSVCFKIECDTIEILDEPASDSDSLDIIIKCDTLYTTVEYDSIVTTIDCRIETTTITEEHFLTHKIYEKYTPMNMERINQWFSEHEDAVLVTDKINKPEKMSSLFIDKSRLMMELFTFEAIEEAKSNGVNFMMTEGLLYPVVHDKLQSLLDNNIQNLAVSRRLLENNIFRELFSECTRNNIKVYVFSINFDPGKDEKYVYDNEMQYIYGMYADKWIEEFETVTSLKEVYSDKFAVSYREGILSVKSAEEIKSIFVYNISGKLVANCSDINSLECQTLIGDNDGLLIVKIQTTDSIEVLKIF